MKVAISVPDQVFTAAERVAKEMRVSRSHLYSEALSQYLGSHGGSAVTAKLNAVYDGNASGVDAGLARAQAQALKDETW